MSALIVVLMTTNVAATAYLIHQNQSKSSEAQVTTTQLDQLKKLYVLAKDFRTELEQITGRINYPGEKEKTEANSYLQEHMLTLQIARLQLARALNDRTINAAEKFLMTCWGLDSIFSDGSRLFAVPKYRFSIYNKVTEQHTLYDGANMSRLESIENDFRVLATTLAKDLGDKEKH